MTLKKYETVEIPGDTQVGTVVYFRQIHPDPNRVLPNLAMREISRYQHEILKGFNAKQPKYVFAEGRFTTSVSTSVGTEVPSSYLKSEMAPLLFSHPPYQAMSIVMTADKIYEMFVGGVTFFQTEGPPTMTLLNEYPKNEIPSRADKAGYENYWRLQNEREDWVTDRIFEFFAQHPGETAYLSFGAAHDFNDNIEKAASVRGRLPRLVSVCWKIPDLWLLNEAVTPEGECPLPR